MSKHIFISYSKKDSDFAWKLAEDLEKRGFKIWIDRAISGGEEWRQWTNCPSVGQVFSHFIALGSFRESFPTARCPDPWGLGDPRGL